MATCTIGECTNPTLARGMCQKHYLRWYRYGDPYFTVDFNDAERVASRLDAKTRKTEGCWLWEGALNAQGYGIVGAFNKRYLAHRLSYELRIGPIPEGLQLDHLCRVHNCIRPEHLDPVTAAVNIARGLLPSVNGKHQKRKTHCPNGHPYEGENLYVHNGRRHCKECRRNEKRRRRNRERGMRSEG